MNKGRGRVMTPEVAKAIEEFRAVGRLEKAIGKLKKIKKEILEARGILEECGWKFTTPWWEVKDAD